MHFFNLWFEGHLQELEPEQPSPPAPETTEPASVLDYV